ncbi:hypothetical protein G4L39_03790 [Limisphaera ngatamarikiensis]|uniref:Uncharacterized protein n=1 Tax=Limisphaera ngatamarikiensis TaxID=1324935 RepID=A0A6M1RT44_9BACT|nr:hypothetical protein [Limisphaera ngatamarikiensis]NGO38521.1 hypothetical protein [Limisphaera ngatamarikiensis]
MSNYIELPRGGQVLSVADAVARQPGGSVRALRLDHPVSKLLAERTAAAGDDPGV